MRAPSGDQIGRRCDPGSAEDTATAAGLGLRVVSAMRNVARGRARLELTNVSRFTVDHDRLWDTMARTVTCSVRRDASYLNWKYVQQPGQDFIRLELRDVDRVRGVVVLAVRDADDVYKYRRAFLVDLVAPLDDPGVLDQLIRAALDAAERAGADALNCLHIGARLTAALTKLGFRMRTPERHLLVRPADLDEESRRAVLAGSSWFVTHGDSDIDRPW